MLPTVFWSDMGCWTELIERIVQSMKLHSDRHATQRKPQQKASLPVIYSTSNL